MSETCNICGKIKSHPYRVYDERGKVTAGCVAGFHEGEIITPSESAYWHNRLEAKKIRRISRMMIKKVITK